MQVKLFDLSAYNEKEDEDRLNLFLRTHKILKVEKEFYHRNGVGHWSLLVSYLESQPAMHQSQQEKKPKIDYKQVLDNDTFAKFSRLREIRKQLALEDAVPAYAVFIDAELAEIAKADNVTPQEMKKINGIGGKRIEKYGLKLCQLFNDENFTE